MTFDDRLIRTAGLVLAGMGPIVVAGLLVGIRGDIVNANVALALVVVVVLAAIAGGREAGVLAAVVATLSFDFFHTQPYLRLTIASANDVETTMLLLVVALAVGELGARAAAAGAAAAARKSEIGRIRRVAELAARGEDQVDVLMAAQGELSELLDLRDCAFESPPRPSTLTRLERSGALVASTFRFDRGDGEFVLPAGGVELPVMGRGAEVGQFVLHPRPGTTASLEQRVVAVAIADQVGAALAAPPSPKERVGSRG